MANISATDLDRRLRIERPVADASFDGAGSGTWEPVATVWAQVQDVLPSRSERLADGISISSRPARVRMYWRRGITSSMRFVVGNRTMQIISGPADLDGRVFMEFMAEDYTAAGNSA